MVNTIASSTTSASSTPADELENNKKFARWVADFSARACAAGIDEVTLHGAFDNVRFQERIARGRTNCSNCAP